MTKNTEDKKILVADDDPGIVDALQLMLETVGYSVETTSDGETIKTLKKDFPNLLLLDIWMSGQDGKDICIALKKNPHTKHIPIIMISANKDTAEIAQEAGANDYVTKPFEMDDLLQKIEKHII